MALGVLAVGVIAIAALGLGASSGPTKVFDSGVAPVVPIVDLAPEQVACQSPVLVAERFDRVGFGADGLAGRGTDEVEVLVRARGVVLASGRGVASGSAPRIELDGPVQPGRAVDVCIANRSESTLGLRGGPAASRPDARATVGGEPRPSDLALSFERSGRESNASRLLAIPRRATLFSASWAGPWLAWMIAALILVAAPVATTSAWRAARAEDDRPR